MRCILLVFIFCHFAAFSQFRNEWKPLPKVKSTKAIINKRVALIDTIVSKEEAPKIQEVYNTAKLEFISKVIPDTLEKLTYEAYPLNWTKKEALPNGLMFKDIATNNIKYLDKPHGLPDKCINSIAEDGNGLIYLASESGLLVFDGFEITVYENHSYFSFNNSKSIYYDKDGKLWIATDEQVGYIYENKLYLPETQIFGGVHQQAFREDRNGDFLISTNYNGLFIIKKDFILHYEKDLPHSMTADAIRTSDGKLWIAFPRHGVGFIRNDSLFAYKEFGDYNNSRAFLEHNGELWIGNFAAPLLKYRNDSLFTVKLNTPDNYVYSLVGNSKGVWFSVYGTGVFLVKPNGEYYRFDEENGLNGRYPFHLIVDSYENVWVADVFAGLSRIDENFFYMKSGSPFMVDINEIETDQRGNSWYFKSGGFLTKETSDSYTTYKNIPDSAFLLHGHCLDGFIRDDGIWMASYNMGIIHLEDMEYTYHQINDKGHFDNTMLYLEHDDAGGIWTVTINNHLLRLHNDQFHNFSNSEEWRDFVFTAMKKTNGGEIFVTTKRNGIILIQEDRYQKIALLESPNSNQVYHVFKDLSGEFWFFMNNEIQIMKNDGSFSKVENSIFRNNPITDLIEVEKGNFLGVSSNGIISIKKKQDGLEIRMYDRNRGLYMVDNVSINQKSDNKVIIANRTGIVLSDSTFINKKPPPKLSFNRVEVDNETIHVTENAFSAEQGKQIRLVFNKIFWGNRSTLYYKLGHNNKEGNWNEQESGVLAFQELSHGDYQLSVYAMGDNQKSAELKISFEIRPYWYQTTWSKVLFVSLIVGLVIAYFLYREKQARIVKLRLEGLVNVKTSELASQLEQKEILVQEVHHRVKNNLTFLKSLLFLRSNATEDNDVKLVLDECQARIQSMALVHQNLYDVDDASQVDFEFFLRELFTELGSMFDQADLKLSLDTNDIRLDMKLSVFLGLIINELITNSMKYAFDGASEKHVFITFKAAEGNYLLTYADNGQGLPVDFDLHSTTGFGFRLIRILLDQVDAEMTYEQNELSTFNILIAK